MMPNNATHNPGKTITGKTITGKSIIGKTEIISFEIDTHIIKSKNYFTITVKRFNAKYLLATHIPDIQ